uniref:cDNA clone:J023053H09, full insert sequence n=3 Tax=Oryza TaxID=4527 RepID=B7EHT8_ORYSJ|nr:unnamed protein product [Oryza sativa Japonica Group]
MLPPPFPLDLAERRVPPLPGRFLPSRRLWHRGARRRAAAGPPPPLPSDLAEGRAPPWWMEEEERSAATVVDGRGGERRRKKWRERRKKKRGGSGLRVREIEFEREGGEEEIRMGVDRVAQLGSVSSADRCRF